MDLIVTTLSSPLALVVGFALIAFGALRLRRFAADKNSAEGK